MDRIDIHLELSRLNREEIESLGSRLDPEMDRAMYQRVETAQSFATELKQSPEELLSLDRESKDFISEASHKLGLSARAYTKTLRLGRSIANLEQSEQLRLEHIAEALQYRSLNWDQLRQSPRGVYH